MTQIKGREWTCPKCGGHQLITYVEEVTVLADGDCDFKQEREDEYEGGDELIYRCASCDREFTWKYFAVLAAELPQPGDEEDDDSEEE